MEDFQYRKTLFVISMHILETGNVRHFNIKYNERICKFLCNKTVEDEIHFLMSCEKLKESTSYFIFKGNLQNISKSQQTAYIHVRVTNIYD